MYLDVQHGEMTAKRIFLHDNLPTSVITGVRLDVSVGIQTLLIGKKNRWLDIAWYSDSAQNKP